MGTMNLAIPENPLAATSTAQKSDTFMLGGYPRESTWLLWHGMSHKERHHTKQLPSVIRVDIIAFIVSFL